MKRTLLALLLTLVMVVCFTAFAAFAEEATVVEETAVAEETTAAEEIAVAEETAEHVHCVCGGAPMGAAANHSCADVIWQPLPEGTTDFGKLPKGNYYLTGDVTVTSYSTQIKVDLKICLNGHNINTNVARVFGNTRTSSGKLTVTDCSYDAATKTWGGTITGGDSSSGYGSIIYTHYSSKLNIYGGNWTGNGSHIRMGGLIVVAQDGAPDTKDEAGNVTLAGTSDPTKAATLNIYGGKIYGGYAGTGGNIHVMHCGKLNVYGGTITGGQTKFIQWTIDGKTSYKYGQGGNIYSDSGTTIKIYGGEISNGKCLHGGTIKSTYSTGSGGNIYATGDLFIYGGSIFGGHAQQNTLTKDGAYIKTNSGSTAAEYDGRGGNIYATKNLTIAGGCIYDGKANGLTGGNIYYSGSGKLFTMSGGKIWGGEANADKDAAKSSGLVNSYDACGGSIRISGGTFNMTGGSIGIDANGNPAGGTCYPSGSEAGNIYASSSSITMNLSGGVIAYGNILGVNEDGTLIKGLVSKGGNIGGSAKYTYSGDIIVRDGYAVNYGGNIVLFNSGNTKIQGGTISGGESKYGGNIAMTGSGTSVNVLEITGGTIKNGKASNGGNVYVDFYKQLEITDGTFEGGKTSSDGGSIYGGPNTVITITDSTFDGGECTGSGGGNIYTTGVITMEKVTLKNGVSKYAGANFRVNSSDYASVTLTDCIFEGGNSGSYGGNAYIADQATITGCTFKNGNATTAGGNLSINGTAAVAIENCTFENGTSSSIGGSVYLTDNSNVTLTNCSMSGGRADDGAEKKAFTYGGNLYSKSKTLTIQGGTYENGAAQSAGNMYLAGTTATVTGVTFKNGDATLQCDGTTNGNGGNLQATGACTATVTGCTFEGGKAMRGGSIAVFGQVSLIDCTVGGGQAASGGGTVFVYQKGCINITGNTEIGAGKVTNNGATGGTMNINSFEATEPNYIGDGVKIHTGTASQGSGIYLSDGVLALAGNVQIENIWVHNTAETCYIDATDLNTTSPIALSVNKVGKIGVSETDKSACFTYAKGKVLYADGVLSVAEFMVQVADTKYVFLQDAVDALAKGGMITLLKDCSQDATITKDLYLDLNGKDLTGAITVAEGVTLYGADSTTDDYNCADGYGQITNVTGTVAPQYKATLNGKVRRYVTYTDSETKAVSFHRIYVGVTSVSLRPGASGMGYKATVAGDEKVIEMMDGTVYMTMWVEGNEAGAKTRSAAMDGNRMTFSALVKGIDVEKHHNIKLYANVSVKLGDETLTSTSTNCTMKQAIEAVANAINGGATYTDAQMSAIHDLCSAHSEIVSAWGEVMNHILNWTPAA